MCITRLDYIVMKHTNNTHRVFESFIPTFKGFFNLYVSMWKLSNPLQNNTLISIWSTDKEKATIEHVMLLELYEWVVCIWTCVHMCKEAKILKLQKSFNVYRTRWLGIHGSWMVILLNLYLILLVINLDFGHKLRWNVDKVLS